MRDSLWGTKRELLIVACVALLCGLLASWLWAGRFNSVQQEERDDLNLFLNASSAGWAEVTDQFFEVPEDAAVTIAALSQELTGPQQHIPLLTEIIRTDDALDAAYLGFPDGSFTFVGRSTETVDGFRTRRISEENGVRTVRLTWTDSALNVLRSELDESDMYDPRERPWYEPIQEQNQSSWWTEPYRFASSQELGITHSAEVRDEQGTLVAVVGIDIRLTRLAAFLDELRPGPNGESIVLDRQGQVIASAPMVTRDERTDTESMALGNSPELLDAISDFNDLDPEELASSVVRSADQDYTTVSRPAGSSDQWYLAVRARDSDFLGDASESTTRKILGLLAVGVATAVFVLFLGLLALRYLSALRDQADRDELTGVLSRRGVKRELDALVRGSSPVTLAIIDLDRFKAINDTHGHPMGDLVLEAAAGRIDAFATARGAKAGRLGGDEFVVIAEGPIQWADLNGLLAGPMEFDGQDFEVAASIGVATSDGERELSADDLLREADLALFEIKRAGGGAHGVATDRRGIRSLRATGEGNQGGSS